MESPAVSAVKTFITDARKRKVGVQRGDDGLVRCEERTRDPAFDTELTKPHHQAKLLIIAEEQAEEMLAIGKVAENHPAMLREWADPKKRHPELPQSVLNALTKWSGHESVMRMVAELSKAGTVEVSKLHHQENEMSRSIAREGEGTEAGGGSPGSPELINGQQPPKVDGRSSAVDSPATAVDQSSRPVPARPEAPRSAEGNTDDGSPGSHPSDGTEMVAKWRASNAEARALLEYGGAQGPIRCCEKERDRLAYVLHASLAKGELEGRALHQDEERELEMQARRYQMRLGGLGAQQGFGR